jgi:hypothetical protein
VLYKYVSTLLSTYLLFKNHGLYLCNPQATIQKRSINHPLFAQIFPLLPEPSLRLRVLLYASNNFQAQINSLESFPSDPDCQAVTVVSTNFKFNLINVYNEDDQQGVHEHTIERILLSKQLPADCLVLSDFNTHDL